MIVVPCCCLSVSGCLVVVVVSFLMSGKYLVIGHVVLGLHFFTGFGVSWPSQRKDFSFSVLFYDLFFPFSVFSHKLYSP